MIERILAGDPIVLLVTVLLLIAAGGLGASLYAIFCPVDNALFVAGWYSLAIGAVTMACSCLGQRWLRW